MSSNYGAASCGTQVVRKALKLTGSVESERFRESHSKAWSSSSLKSIGQTELDHDVIWLSHGSVRRNDLSTGQFTWLEVFLEHLEWLVGLCNYVLVLVFDQDGEISRVSYRVWVDHVLDLHTCWLGVKE